MATSQRRRIASYSRSSEICNNECTTEDGSQADVAVQGTPPTPRHTHYQNKTALQLLTTLSDLLQVGAATASAGQYGAGPGLEGRLGRACGRLLETKCAARTPGGPLAHDARRGTDVAELQP